MDPTHPYRIRLARAEEVLRLQVWVACLEDDRALEERRRCSVTFESPAP